MSEGARDRVVTEEAAHAPKSGIGARASGPAPERKRRGWGYAVFALFAFGIGAFVWATDFITLDGEWTIYTATCDGGKWVGPSCTGRLRPAERYRFRALKAHREVLFWTAGARDESGRYTACTIQNGRTWTCPPNDHSNRTITHEMLKGVPVAAPASHPLAFHRIPKWKWEALRIGIPVGATAQN